MLRRLLTPCLIALALLATSGCGDAGSPAARIGDVAISNADFLDEVAEWVGNPAAVGPEPLVGMPPGTYPLQLVSQLLQQRITLEVHNAEFASLGLRLDDELRDDALAQLFGDAAGAAEPFSAFSDEFAAAFTDDLARQLGVQQELGDDYQDWLTEALTGVEVNPRYGSWDDATGQVVPPAGPTQPVANGF